MKTLVFLFITTCLLSFVMKLEDPAALKKIKWKTLDSEMAVRAEMDKRILERSNFDVDYAILSKEKHEFLEAQGDTLILFHSPYIPSHFLSLVSRKWMLTFHFKNKILTNYTIEKGLLGP